MIQHVILECDLSLLVTDDWEFQVGSADLVDILDPAAMALNGVGRQANKLNTSSCELWLEFGKGAQLGSADRSVILRVREQDYPLVTDELMEVDRSSGGLGLEVRSGRTETKTVKTVSTVCQIGRGDWELTALVCQPC